MRMLGVQRTYLLRNTSIRTENWVRSAVRGLHGIIDFIFVLIRRKHVFLFKYYKSTFRKYCLQNIIFIKPYVIMLIYDKMARKITIKIKLVNGYREE